MARFKYTGKDKAGSMTKGYVDAFSKEEAAILLGKNKITPIVITKDNDILNRIKNIHLFDHLSLSDKMMFCEELSTLINAGVPLAQSISIIKEQSQKGVMKKVTDGLLKDIEGGQSLSGALENQGKFFSPVFVNMVRTGETSGTLDVTMRDLAVQTEKDHDLVSKIRSAMTYPAVILVVMTGAVIFLLVKVVPAISGLFDELGATLPLTTRIMIAISQIIVHDGIFLAIGAVAIIIGIYMALTRVAPIQKVFHAVILKVPIIGNISLKFNLARFSRTLGSLLGSGVSVLEALEIVSHSTKNVIFSNEVEKVKEKVRNGAPLAEPLKQSKIFPTIVFQMVGVGEETGNLDKMLIKIAEFYERQIESFTKNLSGIIEPIIMLIVGVAVGFIIVSIITPIYQATQNIH